MDPQPIDTRSNTIQLRTQLSGMHQSLLAIHKALLDHERERFEAKYGAIGAPADVLQVVIKDPWFAWLRPLTVLITQIDEFTSSRKPLPDADGEALVAAARTMMVPSETGELFAQNYLRTIQESPDVAWTHAQWKQSL